MNVKLATVVQQPLGVIYVSIIIIMNSTSTITKFFIWITAPTCAFDRGYVLDSNGKCVCPPGFGLDENDNCVPCPFEKGYKVNERGRCICATDRGMIIDAEGRCICPVDQKYVLRNGYCEPIPPDCVVDDDCPDDRFCYLKNHTCIPPCTLSVCGDQAYCVDIHHIAVCRCPEGRPTVYFFSIAIFSYFVILSYQFNV